MNLPTGRFHGVPYSKMAAGFELPVMDAYESNLPHSPSLKYYLAHQWDGNLVLYRSSGRKALWASNTMGGEKRARKLLMQGDGNFVLYWTSPNIGSYSPTSMEGFHPRWSTNTHGNPGAFLALQDDGNLVIYTADNTRALWASGTNEH
ncbi:hypothetical protein [Nannocystis sp.]|uniref:hypothetical protein n=1 Tax=Nannocystis sp. TaxID=1962667 RepID=UPI0024227DAE|nr:hypothetical protein [Nannocystis sp.]MBK7826920.1 hypothetical protein [Nannocystis sp.]MBK9756045.1 hypothetical protein [Nannocystis sp.]